MCRLAVELRVLLADGFALFFFPYPSLYPTLMWTATNRSCFLSFPWDNKFQYQLRVSFIGQIRGKNSTPTPPSPPPQLPLTLSETKPLCMSKFRNAQRALDRTTVYMRCVVQNACNMTKSGSPPTFHPTRFPLLHPRNPPTTNALRVLIMHTEIHVILYRGVCTIYDGWCGRGGGGEWRVVDGWCSVQVTNTTPAITRTKYP